MSTYWILSIVIVCGLLFWGICYLQNKGTSLFEINKPTPAPLPPSSNVIEIPIKIIITVEVKGASAEVVIENGMLAKFPGPKNIVVIETQEAQGKPSNLL